MTNSAEVELHKFVNNEIDLGFTYLRTARLASSEEHRTQAIRNANEACDNAEHFMLRLGADELDPAWPSRVAELRIDIESVSE